MDVLGFGDDEKLSLFKTVAAVLHFGNIVVKQRPREEQAEIPSTSGIQYKWLLYLVVCILSVWFVVTEAEKVAYLLGINSTDLVRCLLRPRIKVGSEYVMKGRNLQQVTPLLWTVLCRYHLFCAPLGGILHWGSFQEFVWAYVQVAGWSCQQNTGYQGMYVVTISHSEIWGDLVWL